MIRKISFENFYSFGGKQIIDFTTSKKKSSDYFTSYDGVQISKVAGFIGGNGSGKTNAMKVFVFLSYIFTKKGFEDKFDLPEYDTDFKKYLFSSKKKTFLDVEFETNDFLCQYYISLDENKIYEEELKVKKLKKGSRFISIFKRQKDDFILNKKYLPGITAKKLKSIRDDHSFVSFAESNYDIPVISNIHFYFLNFFTNDVNESGFVRSSEFQIQRAAGMYSQHKQLRSLLLEFMKNFGLGIDGLSFEKHNDEFNVLVDHIVSGENFQLPLYYESRGTKLLFSEILHALIFFNLGNLLIFDEIETGLHPNAVDKLIQYILDKIGEEKKQFIFATHSHGFLKKFNSDQIYLVDKIDNSSEVYKLSDLDEVRTDENFHAKYASGSYGAFPKIRI
jgi:AAA15 family ATPase/GTPase